MKLSNVKIQYIWKGSKKNNTRRKKGVMVAGLTPDNDVAIGFSLCHKNDRFDYLNKKEKTPKFGQTLAIQRALKWANYKKSIRDTYANQDLKQAIKRSNQALLIPETVYNNLHRFIERCARYYKDAHRLPIWTVDVKGKDENE